MITTLIEFVLANTITQKEESLSKEYTHNMISKDLDTSNTEKAAESSNLMPNMISFKNILIGETSRKVGPNAEEAIDMQESNQQNGDIRVEEN